MIFSFFSTLLWNCITSTQGFSHSPKYLCTLLWAFLFPSYPCPSLQLNLPSKEAPQDYAFWLGDSSNEGGAILGEWIKEYLYGQFVCKNVKMEGPSEGTAFAFSTLSSTSQSILGLSDIIPACSRPTGLGIRSYAHRPFSSLSSVAITKVNANC